MSSLSRDVVLTAALSLGDDGGLQAVTLRGVADRLGVTPMALYRYVVGKEDLLDGLAELLYSELERPNASADWWEALADVARSARNILLTRPWTLTLFARPLTGPHGHALDDWLSDALRLGGFSAADTQELHDQISNMVFSLISAELAGKPNRDAFERGLELLHVGLKARRQGQ